MIGRRGPRVYFFRRNRAQHPSTFNPTSPSSTVRKTSRPLAEKIASSPSCRNDTNGFSVAGISVEASRFQTPFSRFTTRAVVPRTVAHEQARGRMAGPDDARGEDLQEGRGGPLGSEETAHEVDRHAVKASNIAVAAQSKGTIAA